MLLVCNNLSNERSSLSDGSRKRRGPKCRKLQQKVLYNFPAGAEGKYYSTN